MERDAKTFDGSETERTRARDGDRGNEEKREKQRKREERGETFPTKRSTRLFAAANHLFMESALIRETRGPERKGEPSAARGARGTAPWRPVLGIPNSTKPSENSRKVPFTNLGPSISLAPFPGTPGARGLV